VTQIIDFLEILQKSHKQFSSMIYLELAESDPLREKLDGTTERIKSLLSEHTNRILEVESARVDELSNLMELKNYMTVFLPTVLTTRSIIARVELSNNIDMFAGRVLAKYIELAEKEFTKESFEAKSFEWLDLSYHTIEKLLYHVHSSQYTTFMNFCHTIDYKIHVYYIKTCNDMNQLQDMINTWCESNKYLSYVPRCCPDMIFLYRDVVALRRQVLDRMCELGCEASQLTESTREQIVQIEKQRIIESRDIPKLERELSVIEKMPILLEPKKQLKNQAQRSITDIVESEMRYITGSRSIADLERKLPGIMSIQASDLREGFVNKIQKRMTEIEDQHITELQRITDLERELPVIERMSIPLDQQNQLIDQAQKRMRSIREHTKCMAITHIEQSEDMSGIKSILENIADESLEANQIEQIERKVLLKSFDLIETCIDMQILLNYLNAIDLMLIKAELKEALKSEVVNRVLELIKVCSDTDDLLDYFNKIDEMQIEATQAKGLKSEVIERTSELIKTWNDTDIAASQKYFAIIARMMLESDTRCKLNKLVENRIFWQRVNIIVSMISINILIAAMLMSALVIGGLFLAGVKTNALAMIQNFFSSIMHFTNITAMSVIFCVIGGAGIVIFSWYVVMCKLKKIAEKLRCKYDESRSERLNDAQRQRVDAQRQRVDVQRQRVDVQRQRVDAQEQGVDD